MTCSGILVHAAPGEFAPVVAQLESLPGTRVHQQDPASGRIVVTLEAPSVDDEIDGLRRIQQAPGVLSASLVYHRLETEDGTSADGNATDQGEPR